MRLSSNGIYRFEVRLFWARAHGKALSSRQCEHILPVRLCYHHIVLLLPGYPSSSPAKVAWYQFSENEIQPLRTVTVACSHLGMFGRVWKVVSARQPGSPQPQQNGRRPGCEVEYQTPHFAFLSASNPETLCLFTSSDKPFKSLGMCQ